MVYFAPFGNKVHPARPIRLDGAPGPLCPYYTASGGGSKQNLWKNPAAPEKRATGI